MATLQEIMGLNAGIKEDGGDYILGDERIGEILGDLQGNILTWHNRKTAHYFFVDFKKSNSDELMATKRLLQAFGQGIGNANEAMQASLRSMDMMRNAGGSSQDSVATEDAGAGGALFMDPGDFAFLRTLKITSEKELRDELASAAVSSGSMRKSPGNYYLGLLLTSKGYASLGFDKNNPAHPLSQAFRDGMINREKLLDTKPTDWKLLQEPADALIILAYNPNASAINETVHAFKNIIGKYLVRKGGEELGVALESKSLDSATGKSWFYEPLGYRDGISQPLFYQSDILSNQSRDKAATTGIPTKNSNRWDPSAPLKLVLVQDLGGSPVSFGSYFVYRKLREDIFAFYKQIEIMEEKYGMDRGMAFAWIMGRYPDGTPLTVEASKSVRNDFDYGDDRIGAVCPFHAHSRKANPRLESLETSRVDNRIARRALCFGPILEGRCAPNEGRTENTLLKETWTSLEKSDDEYGLHFMCAQSDIESQFEQIQAGWANNPNPSYQDHEKDALIGQPSTGDRAIGIRDPNNDSPSLRERIPLANFITLLGGDYFFAPSIRFFQNLVQL